MDEDDDDYLFDNLDEDELLHVVETAEQKHTQSQVAQTRRGASTAAATRPAGPFRPSTIIEAPKVSVHKQQPGGSSNGHTGSSGPANNLQPAAPRIRPPKRPTYRDEFPDVVLDDKVGGYRPKPGVPSEKTADPEKDALKQELERLKASIAQEQKARYQKEGEVKIVRSRLEQTAAEHQKLINEEHARNLALQERIAALERSAAEEKQRYRSEILFARQEHESAVRHQRTASQFPSRSRQAPFSATQASRPASSPKGVGPGGAGTSKKGFQNSFFEGAGSQRLGGPRSAARNGRDSSPQSSPSRGGGKGKERGLDQDEEMLEAQQAGTGAGDEHEQLLEAAQVVNLVYSVRDEAMSFIFAHTPCEVWDGPPSIQTLLNMPPQSVDFDRAHTKACQDLFTIFGQAYLNLVEPGPIRKADHQFICRLGDNLVTFVGLLHKHSKRYELEVSLGLLRDFVFRFEGKLWDPEHLPGDGESGRFTKNLFSIFQEIVISAREAFALAQGAARKAKSNGTSQRRTLLPSTSNAYQRPMHNESPVVKLERELEPTLLAVLDTLQIVTFTADETRLSRLSQLIKLPGFFATLLDLMRSYAVLAETLRLLLLLSFHPSLFRTLLACPIGKAAVAAAAVPSKTAAAATTTTTTGTTTPLTTNATDPLAFVEALAGYLLHHSHHPVQNYIINTTALTILSTLSVQHADGVALLSQSSALVQRLIVRIAKDAAVLYESAFLPRNPPSAPRVIECAACAVRLLHFLLLTSDAAKPLSHHLHERPRARDYFIAGVGRIACSDVPEWLEDKEAAIVLDQIGAVAEDLLYDVLSPDEIEELYSLCRDDASEADGAEGGDGEVQGNDTINDDEAQLAAQQFDDDEHD